MFIIVDHVKEMTVKKSCEYGECGLFESLLFLFHLCLLCLQIVSGSSDWWWLDYYAFYFQIEGEVVKILTDAEEKYGNATSITQAWDKLQREVFL